jgi:peptidoglycan/LPS O-acetylase OafA/YrhL
VEWEPLVYLGKISYGIYMYHMIADYAVRQAFTMSHLDGKENLALVLLYGAAVLGIAVVIAHLSYRYVESYFLALGRHRTLAARPVAAA